MELLARARHALAERAAGRRLVLCVDDGQLLDDASATLVHQLVAAGEAFAVVTLRRGDPPPDALRALWKDDLCALLDLGELPREQVEPLLTAALGAPLDGRSVTALWDLTRGNALFLREVVRHGLDHGLLAEDGGVFRWHGEVQAGTRLAEFMDVRIDDAGPGAQVLELVAVADPLELGLLEPGELAALEEIERGELVTRRADGRRRFVAVAHPLHGEAVRARMPPTRIEAIRARLADAVQARGTRRGGDLLRVAVWRLEAGSSGDADLFSRAAERALSVHRRRPGRPPRPRGRAGGRRLPRPADARARPRRPGDAEGAQELLDALATEATDDGERAAVATAAARNLFWGLERADEAEAMLEAHGGAGAGPRPARRARVRSASGSPPRRAGPGGARRGRAAMRDPALDERTRITVALGAIEALFCAGRTRRGGGAGRDVAARGAPRAATSCPRPRRCSSACARSRSGWPAGSPRRRRPPRAPTRRCSSAARPPAPRSRPTRWA